MDALDGEAVSDWPCLCQDCRPPTSCDVCGARGLEFCRPTCSEHPSNRGPCDAMRAVEPEPKIAKGEGV